MFSFFAFSVHKLRRNDEIRVEYLQIFKSKENKMKIGMWKYHQNVMNKLVVFFVTAAIDLRKKKMIYMHDFWPER